MADLHTSSFHAKNRETGMMHSRTMKLVCAALAAAFTGLAPGLALAQPTPETPAPETPPEPPAPEVPAGKVTGKVTEAGGKPIKGATVVVDGTDVKATTDAD